MATIGSPAPSQNTINYDALLSTTLFAYRPKMVDNIFRASAFLAALRKYGGIDYQDGGERVQNLLMYEANNTVKSYSGYETLDTTPQTIVPSGGRSWSVETSVPSASSRFDSTAVRSATSYSES